MRGGDQPDERYDLVVVGTGFAASFFLHRYLRTAKPTARVLVLERGRRWSHRQAIEEPDLFDRLREGTYENLTPEKRWIHTPAFGGGSNCWWACTPRFLPNDLRLRSAYGVGDDWPITYEDLEPFYEEAEEIMAVSGPRETPYPRRRPYPQPPHRLTDPDKALARAFPGQFFPMPTARARLATARRPACCAVGTCTSCPMDAKFTVLNELAPLYADPRVTLRLEAPARAVDMAAGVAQGVVYADTRRPGALHVARGERVVLGANALFNPHLLMRSGLTHRLLGRRLHDQVSGLVVVDLDGMDNFQGSTSLTGHGYMWYDGPHRAERAACLLETSNIPTLRLEAGRWRQRLHLRLIYEDLPLEENGVEPSATDPERPATRFVRRSEYAMRGLEAGWAKLPELLAALPVERVVSTSVRKSETHILGTTVMGNDPATSVIDADLIHHQVRNLFVLGAGAFPTGSPANPTLTIAALSLRAADRADA